jgi:hypothetical protein
MMTEQPLNNWQHGAEHDLAVVHEMDEIIAEAAKLSARHEYLLSLVPRQPTLDAVLLMLAEADRCMKAILEQLLEMELLCEKELL